MRRATSRTRNGLSWKPAESQSLAGIDGAEDSAGAERRLSVGVGIATGSAFVENLQALDRTIWTAVGDTANPAARLQSLTRQLDAGIVIDRAT